MARGVMQWQAEVVAEDEPAFEPHQAVGTENHPGRVNS